MCEIKPKRLQVVLAHPDDESFAAGGMLAKYAHQDVQVILLCATRGEAGITGVNPKEAEYIRELELRQATEHLGIEVYFLGYRDGELAKTDPYKLPETIACWIDLLQPQVEVDISDYKLAKIRAIQCHAGQNPGLPGKPEEEMEKIPCHEIYTVARDAKTTENYPDWFEPQREDAAISGSDTCTQMWVKMAKDKGVTNEEITEAIMVARYMKQATVNDTASNALLMLSTDK